MSNAYIWLIIGIASIALGIFGRIEVRDKESKSRSFFEIWRHTINYFLTGAIGYFIVAIRWPRIAESGNLSTSDFVIFSAFLMGIFGWWPYFIKNITEGISIIIDKTLKK